MQIEISDGAAREISDSIEASMNDLHLYSKCTGIDVVSEYATLSVIKSKIDEKLN
jgi:hypothetical protein